MGPVAVWDITWKWTDECKKPWIDFMTGYAKKWGFQKEEGEGGYLHGQGRMSLTSKKELHMLKELMTKEGLAGFHLSQTCTTVAKTVDMFYVIKQDTRVEGPWTDKDVVEEKVMTRQLQKIKQLYPWQESVKEYLKNWDDRKILCVVQPSGDVGKSGFCEYLEYHDLAYEIPPMNDMQDIMQCVCGLNLKWKNFTIDMPKAMKKDKLCGFFAGLECLKNGVAYDKRYNFKKRRFDRPVIVVFTNSMPDTDLLSQDRWDFRQIYDLELKSI